MAHHASQRPPDASDRLRLVPPPVSPARTTVGRLREAIASTHWSGSALGDLARRAGGVDALAGLTTDPLPPTPLDPAPHDIAVRPVVEAVIDAVADRLSMLLHAEERVLICRLVHRLADKPDELGRGETQRTVAALVWLALRSREAGRRPRLGWVWELFGVPQSAPRAHSLHRALGFQADDLAELPPCSLPDPELLVSADRKRMITHRDALLVQYAEHLRHVEEARPMKVTNGELRARSRVIRPLWSAQGSTESGRRMVMIAVDHVASLDRPSRDRNRAPDDVDEVIGLTVPDAWVLLRQLQLALSAAPSA